MLCCSTMKARTTDPAESAKALLLWARKERIAVSSIRVGDVELQLMDTALASTTPAPKSESELRQSLYERYGGEVLSAATKDDEDHASYEDDDDDVVTQ